MSSIGTPPPVLLPARLYRHEFGSAEEVLTVPVSGPYPESCNRPGEYNICPEPGVILFGTLTEALFAHRKYPHLEENQLFVILGLDLNEEDGEISVVGKVINMLQEEEEGE